jgi:signal transduction histidine kinase
VTAARLALRALRLDAAMVIPALLVMVGYYLAARLGLALTLHPHPISTLWPPNALLMAALLLSPTSSWWLLVVAALPAHLLAELQGGVPLAMVLGWYFSNCAEALIGAGLTRAFVPGPLRMDTFRSAGVFLLCGALAAPLASTFVDAALVRLIGFGEGEFWSLVRTRFFSNVLAELTIVPLVLTWAALGWRGLRVQPPARHVEAAVLLLGLLASSLVIFDLTLFDANLAPALFYAPLPFLLWAAVRLGTAGTATALATLTFATIWGAVHGLGPFVGGAPQDTARDMQLFLIAVSVPLLLLAVALEERARNARESSEQRQQLTHLSRVALLSEMSGGLAHELNQPLTAILSNAQAAQALIVGKNIDDAELLEILRDIIGAEQRAGEVISRLRALFKRGEIRFIRLDVNRLVQETLSLANGDLTTRSIQTLTQLAPALPAVRGDRVQLQQVMLNLIMNACEAMAGIRTEERKLTVRTLAADGRVYLTVTDHGPGFAPEEHERLFEPYYTTKPHGLGLGLSISRTIVAAHGGKLWGVGTPGAGATFHVALPVVGP